MEALIALWSIILANSFTGERQPQCGEESKRDVVTELQSKVDRQWNMGHCGGHNDYQGALSELPIGIKRCLFVQSAFARKTKVRA